MSSKWMELALSLAKQAYERDEVPVGAVIVERATDTLVAQAHNLVERENNPLNHAEMLAMNTAMQVRNNNERLRGCDLYATLEPCPMCASAISHARLDTLYFGAYDPKSGGVTHGPRVLDNPSCHHKPQIIGGIMEHECATLLSNFFEQKR